MLPGGEMLGPDARDGFAGFDAAPALDLALRGWPPVAAGVTLSLRCARGEVPVTVGPADHHAAPGHHAASGRGRLRASHADREHVIDVLRAAFVQGRLTKDELDARAGRTFAARTYTDLAALTADLPAGPAVARAARMPAQEPARPPVTKAVLACAGAAIAPALTVIAIATDSESLAKWVFLVAVVYLVAWLAAGAQMLDIWYRRRSRGQRPRRRVHRGQALARPGME
jgi:hypothetical protein